MTRIEDVADCQRIQRVMLQYGWECTLHECQELWRARSGAWDAQWLFLPKSESEIWEAIEQYAENSEVWKNRKTY